MTPKQKTLQAPGTLSEDASYDQLQEEVKILAALEDEGVVDDESRVFVQDVVGSEPDFSQRSRTKQRGIEPANAGRQLSSVGNRSRCPLKFSP